MKGRKRKPRILAIEDGFTHHENRPPSPEPSRGDFEPPFELNPVALKEWNRIRSEAYWITASDALLLAERCSAHSDLQAVKQSIASGAKGKGRPLTAIRNELRAYILRADAELGLTSSSLSRVNAQPRKQGQSIEDVMFA